MTDRKKIEARIAELREELGRAEGTSTEVYSRIVGYYRSVRNWNAGKREEYGRRLVYAMPSGEALPKGPASAGEEERELVVAAAPAVEQAPVVTAAPVAAPVPVAASMVEPTAATLRDGVLVFTREQCPNCPPVANYVLSSGMKAVFVDVDEDDGLALARDYGIMATPTVLALDGEGRESFRAFDLKSLRSRVESLTPAGAC
jgi:hypothetical protein